MGPTPKACISASTAWEQSLFYYLSWSFYAAATYARQERHDGTARVTLVMAKARPAPIRKRSIPMLELQGAVLGVRLASEVGSALSIPKSDRRFWTDSMNVLHWVRSTSRKFKVDVGNRIAQVQETSESSQWNHLSGKMNPANRATRGLTVDKLAMDDNWWHGPDFLSKVQSSWPRKRKLSLRKHFLVKQREKTCQHL